MRIRHDPGFQNRPDILDAAFLPLRVSGCAVREENEVLVAGAEVVDAGRGHGGDNVEFLRDASAVRVQWEVVDVVAEGVLDFTADGGDAEDDVCGGCNGRVRAG